MWPGSLPSTTTGRRPSSRPTWGGTCRGPRCTSSTMTYRDTEERSSVSLYVIVLLVQRGPRQVPPQVGREEGRRPVVVLGSEPGHMRRDQHVGHAPQRRLLRQRLLI